MWLRNVKIFFIIFLLTGLFSIFLVNYGNAGSVGLWLKEGIYVEYRDKEDVAIEFLNGTIMTSEGGEIIFRWECLRLINDSVVELNVFISLIGEIRFIGTTYRKIESFNTSTTVFVDVDSRDVYSFDGKYCGKTALWLPTGLNEGDKVVFGLNDSLVEGTVTEVGRSSVKTPLYGYQRVFNVEFETEEPVNVTYGNETYKYRLWNWLGYDMDTGILLSMAGLRAEGVLFALGIWMLPSLGLIYRTNVDLGPGLIWPQILDLMLFVVPPAIFFTIVFFAVYWRRRRRRRLAGRCRR